MSRLALYWELARPFTLIPPALGMLSGGLTALGAGVPVAASGGLILNVTLGVLMAAMLNAASNAINQIYDLDVDQINKPGRPIPSGRMGIREAGWVTLAFYATALGLAAAVNWECFVLAAAAAFFTVIYSVPPIRTKANAILANITISIPRGVLLKVAGWTTVRSAFVAGSSKESFSLVGEPWYIGLVFGLFLLGAATTKDFADMEGDEAGGCLTLPVKYGPKKAAWMIAPFFILPFLLIPYGVSAGILTGDALLLNIFGYGLAAWGAYTVYLILRDPEELARTENHISWRHMYLMMMTAQVAFIVAYLAKYL